MAIGILVSDFEFFIGARRQLTRVDKSLKLPVIVIVLIWFKAYNLDLDFSLAEKCQ